MTLAELPRRALGALLPAGCYRRLCPFSSLLGGLVGPWRGYVER